jgi:hypothetical protein
LYSGKQWQNHQAQLQFDSEVTNCKFGDANQFMVVASCKNEEKLNLYTI